MKNIIRLSRLSSALCAILTVFTWPCFGQEPSFKSQPLKTVPGEVIIKYRSTDARATANEKKVIPLLKLNRIETLARFNIERVRVEPGQSVQTALKALRQQPTVQFADPNYIVYAHQEKMPDDPRWSDLWGMNKIGMPKAWRRISGSRKVVVAVIDTGVDYTHRDLKANIWKSSRGEIGMSFCTDLSDPNNARILPPKGDGMDQNGHGTHVAGTIAAEGNNKTDVAGANWELNIMALRFLCNPDGSGTTADALRAIEYALNNGAQILNNSWGGGGPSDALQAAIEEASNRGVLFVASAGNSGTDIDKSPSYPAAYGGDNVIAVAAIKSDDTLPGFSNWGLKSVQIAAPGVDILSTVPGDRVESFNGTSMAAPHVSGCAALFKAIKPSARAKDLKSELLRVADKVSALNGKVEGGRRLNCGGLF